MIASTNERQTWTGGETGALDKAGIKRQVDRFYYSPRSKAGMDSTKPLFAKGSMMKKSTITAVIIVIMLVIFLVALLTLKTQELRASNTLLRKIKVLQSGTYLPSVTNKLGYLMYEIADAEYMTIQGSIKDPAFCQNKKLFWFAASTPPCRALEVYTDTNNVVVYVTWQGL